MSNIIFYPSKTYIEINLRQLLIYNYNENCNYIYYKDLDLNNVNINKLPNNLIILGKLSIKNTQIKKLPNANNFRFKSIECDFYIDEFTLARHCKDFNKKD